MSACYCTGACRRLGHCPNASGRPVWDALPDIVREMASIPVDEQRSLFREHCKRRVRVRAWRVPNEDQPAWDVILLRSLAGYVRRAANKWSARL